PGEQPKRVHFVLGGLRPPRVVVYATVPHCDRTISPRSVSSNASPHSSRVGCCLRRHEPKRYCRLMESRANGGPMTALKKNEQHIRDSAGRKKHPSVASAAPDAKSGTVAISGELPVHRLGFGAMQLTGRGVWGEPADRAEAIAVLRRAVELGINLIDTADSYGPYVSEELIREALFPYPKGLVIATKAGLARTGPSRWIPLGRPEYLRQECEMSLRRLGLERIDLFQLHRIDPKVPADDQFGVLRDLQKEGKVRHVGLSEVNVPEIEAARRIVPIVTVQNQYNLAYRNYEDVLDY